MSKQYYFRKTKIICTIGPSCEDYHTLVEMADAGMNVCRLNFSHGSHAEHKKRIETIRQVSRDINRPLAILQDLQGPKIRVRTFKTGKTELKEGAEFILTNREVEGNDEEVSVSYSSFHKDVKIGDPVLLDDGLLRLEVIKKSDLDVHCKVIFGGTLKNKKGINLPNNILSVDALSDKDIEDLNFGMDNDVDFVALSFVQRAHDIRKIKNIIDGRQANIPVIAKIEKPQAVKELDAITDLADGIMVARGDLGVEMNAEEVPVIQKDIINHCNQKGLPVITATQMLESMIQNPRPTRAEASDVANAVLDGTDVVMLSGETAAGKYPVHAVQQMHNIVCHIEEAHYIDTKKRTDREASLFRDFTMAESIAFSAVSSAEMVKARAIVCLSKGGSMPIKIARFRPDTQIWVVTNDWSNWQRTGGLIWGVQAIYMKDLKGSTTDVIEHVMEQLRKKDMASVGQKMVFTAGYPFETGRQTNTMMIDLIK